MTPELKEEFFKFQHVASVQQANAAESEAKLINYRLEALRERYEEYSNQGLNLEQVRRLEKIWFKKDPGNQFIVVK